MSLPKTVFFLCENNITAMYCWIMGNPNDLRTQRESCKTKWSISDDLGLRSVLSHSENIPSDEKCYLYRSTRNHIYYTYLQR